MSSGNCSSPICRGLPRGLPAVRGLITAGSSTPCCGGPGTGPPQHGVDAPAVISPRTAGSPRGRPRQMGLEQFPLLIGQVMTIMHIDILGQPDPSPLRDTP